MPPPQNEARYCRTCGYDLRASKDRCPECGTSFDPAQHKTFYSNPRSHLYRQIRRTVARIMLGGLIVSSPAWLGLLWLWRGWQNEQAVIENLHAKCDPGHFRASTEIAHPWLAKWIPRLDRWNERVTILAVIFQPRPAGDDDLARIGTLSHLTDLEVRNVKATAAGTAGLRGSRHIQVLNLLNAEMDDAALEQLGTLTSLTRLRLPYASGLTEDGLKNLNNLRSLTDLDLSGLKVTDTGLQSLALPELSLLRLYGNKIAGERFDPVQFPHLTALGLDNCEVTDAGLAHISALQGLTQLDLSRNSKITNEGLKHLAELKLTRLYLDGTSITDAGLVPIGRIKTLRILGLSETKITDAGLELLVGLNQLQEIILYGTLITDDGLEKASRKGLPTIFRGGRG